MAQGERKSKKRILRFAESEMRIRLKGLLFLLPLG
jgi:hypothetical protein